ncbi:MAG TPA: phage tail protein [Allosphingosinicella sp.]|nr:phage tail protein [Allosphingosinicella sp.]
MATLILTTVGSVFGGPVGAAVGAVIGQAIDRRVFAPKARHGPRLGDLSVQTSSYGSQIPKLFGTMRVAGTVIWATDLVETRTRSGGGKGRPKTVGYSYAGNFAVALSSRRVTAVRRIWADGKLLRGAGGDFKTKLGDFRLHGGGEDQDADPLIASAEGIGLAPAYRGLAYAVFEDLQLEDYGNRIPSLSFEIEADAEPPAIGAIASELSGGAIADGGTPSVSGYAATGDSVRSAVEALADVVPLTLVDGGASLVLGTPAAAAAAIGRADCSAAPEISRRAAGSVAGEVSLGFYDPARDHQAGLQRAFRDGPTARADSRALAAAVWADEAKGFAEARLSWLWAARSTAKLRLSWRRLGLRPGSVVTLEKEPGHWLVERWLLGPVTVDLELTRLPGREGAVPGASSGRPVSEPDIVHGPTVLRLFDLPLPSEGPEPWLAAVAAGTSPGWRRALLTVSFDGGSSWQDLGPTAQPAVIGTAMNAPAGASGALFDDRNVLDVELLHAGMDLEGRSDSALAGGANLAVLGSELVQFGRAQRVGERRYRLSRLLRGRRGTEWAAGAHVAGEAFVLLERDSILAIPVPPGAVGAEAALFAVGMSDGAGGVSATRTAMAESLRPPSPVHLGAERLASGDVRIGWTRRSRLGWTWASGSDTPLAEEQELYRVTLASAGASRSVTVSEPFLLYTAGEQAADGLAGPLAIDVVQLGTHAASRPAQILFG